MRLIWIFISICFAFLFLFSGKLTTGRPWPTPWPTPGFVLTHVPGLQLWSMKCHEVDVSEFCLLQYLRFKPRSYWSHFEIRTTIFDLMESAQETVLIHVASTYGNFLEQKEVFTWQKCSIPTAFVWYTKWFCWRQMSIKQRSLDFFTSSFISPERSDHDYIGETNCCVNALRSRLLALGACLFWKPRWKPHDSFSPKPFIRAINIWLRLKTSNKSACLKIMRKQKQFSHPY